MMSEMVDQPKHQVDDTAIDWIDDDCVWWDEDTLRAVETPSQASAQAGWSIPGVGRKERAEELPNQARTSGELFTRRTKFVSREMFVCPVGRVHAANLARLTERGQSNCILTSNLRGVDYQTFGEVERLPELQSSTLLSADVQETKLRF